MILYCISNSLFIKSSTSHLKSAYKLNWVTHKWNATLLECRPRVWYTLSGYLIFHSVWSSLFFHCKMIIYNLYIRHYWIFYNPCWIWMHNKYLLMLVLIMHSYKTPAVKISVIRSTCVVYSLNILTNSRF